MRKRINFDQPRANFLRTISIILFELEKEIYTVTFWLAQLFVTRNNLKASHAAVTKFARAQTFDGFVGQKALYAIDLSIVIVWLIVSGVP